MVSEGLSLEVILEPRLSSIRGMEKKHPGITLLLVMPTRVSMAVLAVHPRLLLQADLITTTSLLIKQLEEQLYHLFGMVSE